MKVGNIALENNVFLAPMAGITDAVFRLICKEQGAGLVYTEMVSAKAIYYNDEKSIKLAKVDVCEEPAAIQIFGSDPVIMANVADRLNSSNACIIDINMGCPTPKITKNGEGSALMLEPQLAGKIVKEVSAASVKPVTVKIRKGWDDERVNAVEIAKIAEENGAKAITVHGRTREQFYSGKADWDIIKKVKKAVAIPVIGNGDVFSRKNAESLLIETGCDGVMVGRGAQGNPWIFKDILNKDEESAADIKVSERLSMIKRHMDMLVELKGEHTGVREMRKHIAWYIKGLRNSASVKDKVFHATSREEIVDIISELL